MQCSVKRSLSFESWCFPAGRVWCWYVGIRSNNPPPLGNRKSPLLLCPTCRDGSACARACACGDGVRRSPWKKVKELRRSAHPLTRSPSLLVSPTATALVEKSINFSPPGVPEPFWNLYRCTRMCCHGNPLIHWSAVVTIQRSGVITPHWDLDSRRQLKVVSVKLTYARVVSAAVRS